MLKHRNRLFSVLFFLAVCSFAFISVGGEFLHSHIHHHETQSSHDGCSFYQLQAQAFVSFITILIALLIKLSWQILLVRRRCIIRFYHSLAVPRAPPVSL